MKHYFQIRVPKYFLDDKNRTSYNLLILLKPNFKNDQNQPDFCLQFLNPSKGEPCIT